MRVGGRVAQRDADQHHVAVRQAAVGEQLLERGAADVLRDQVRPVVVDRSFVQRDDPRISEAGGRAGLALEPPADDALAGEDLTATSRSRRSSSASHTVAKAPVPRRRRSR